MPRLDFDHEFGTGIKERLSVPCVVEIDWGSPGKEAITQETDRALGEGI